MEQCCIETFLKIIETRSFSRAAEALHVTQSTISHRLKRLERELDMVLFMRRKGLKSVELTESGVQFVPIAHRWINLWSDCRHLKEGTQAISLTVGGVESLNCYLFPPFYNSLLENPVPFVLDIQTHHTVQLFEEVEKRVLDVAFCVWRKQSPNIVVTPIFSEKMQIITGRDYGAEVIHTDMLDPGHEVFYHWGDDYKSWHDHWFDPRAAPRIKMDMAITLVGLLENGNSWVCMPFCATRFLRRWANVRVYDLINPPPDRICYMLTHRTPKASRRRGITLFQELLADFLAKNDLHM